MKKSGIAATDFVELPGRLTGTKWDDDFLGDQGDAFNVDVRDVYDGKGGHDRIQGLEKGDRLSGGGGNDTIYGGAGGDKMSGGSGNNTLSGGTGKDIIEGGAGADAFFFFAWGADRGGSGMDIIEDFDPREEGEHILLGTLPSDSIATFADLKSRMVQQGDDVNIEFDGGLAMLVLKHVRIDQLHADDFNIYFG